MRAHVFLCMLAYYVEWHLRRDLAPVLFDDDKAAAEAQRPSVVKPAERSPRAQRKAQHQRTDDGWPVHSFRTLLADLATLAKNRVRTKLQGALPCRRHAPPLRRSSKGKPCFTRPRCPSLSSAATPARRR